MSVPLLKSWVKMTPREQAEHLVLDHGFEASYFGDNQALVERLPDAAAVIEAFVEDKHLDEINDGNSYPHPDGREGWHEGDHESYDGVGASYVHKHSPDSPLVRVPESMQVYYNGTDTYNV